MTRTCGLPQRSSGWTHANHYDIGHRAAPEPGAMGGEGRELGRNRERGLENGQRRLQEGRAFWMKGTDVKVPKWDVWCEERLCGMAPGQASGRPWWTRTLLGTFKEKSDPWTFARMMALGKVDVVGGGVGKGRLAMAPRATGEATCYISGEQPGDPAWQWWWSDGGRANMGGTQGSPPQALCVAGGGEERGEACARFPCKDCQQEWMWPLGPSLWLACSADRLREGIADTLRFQHATPGPSATQWSSSSGDTAGNSTARVSLRGLPS